MQSSHQTFYAIPSLLPFMRFYVFQPLLFCNFQSKKRVMIRLSQILTFMNPTRIYLSILKFRIINSTLSMSIATIIASQLLSGDFLGLATVIRLAIMGINYSQHKIRIPDFNFYYFPLCLLLKR